LQQTDSDSAVPSAYEDDDPSVPTAAAAATTGAGASAGAGVVGGSASAAASVAPNRLMAFGKTLEWNIQFAVLNSMFDDRFLVRKG
jgi:hypothetical protein